MTSSGPTTNAVNKLPAKCFQVMRGEKKYKILVIRQISADLRGTPLTCTVSHHMCAEAKKHTHTNSSEQSL